MISMVRPKLGQHFLVNLEVANREVAYADIKPSDVVLEIGPGTGVLTRLLAAKAKQVIAVELDKALVKNLSLWIPKNVELIHADVLTVDFSALARFTKVVANLPFQISSPITFQLLKHPFSKAVLMYQKDFADRMVASHGGGEYSRLSVGVQYKTFCRILEVVHPNCFSPQPKVDSCVVELIPRKDPPFFVENEDFFFELTKCLFTHRRKKIKNTVDQMFGKGCGEYPFSDQRVEELSPAQIGELSNVLFSLTRQ